LQNLIFGTHTLIGTDRPQKSRRLMSVR